MIAADLRSYPGMAETLLSRAFPVGAAVLLTWFAVGALTVSVYHFEEWLIFYLVALAAWQPMAAWLSAQVRWVPAAELFFLLHIPYYVAPFVRGNVEFANLDSGTRLQVGLIVAGFLLTCRIFYGAARSSVAKHSTQPSFMLNRTLSYDWRNQLAWLTIIGWCLATLSLQRGWFPDLGAYFNTVRTLLWSAGTIGMFVLYHEMGCGRLMNVAKGFVIGVTTLTVFFQLSSGFLIGSIIQLATVFLAFFLGANRLPLVTLVMSALLVSFLHVGKAEMRDAFWEEGNSTVSRDPVEIFQYWVAASWRGLDSHADPRGSIIERGNLLVYLTRAVRDTPGYRTHLDGLTYVQGVQVFIPRFLWPDKPRATLPNETLTIYYGIQTETSVDSTSIGMGRISEAWANFGWAGILLIGGLMGLLLRVPTWLSYGYTLLHVRFLLTIPFISFGMTLEDSLGPATHALSSSLVFASAFLAFASVPRTASESKATLNTGLQRSPEIAK